ncbi:hypothetical protein, partial [Afifella marina]|uniref:hypothetical protein n=1 Tax=Afifella marina TaxID=1080 RepID=UPI001AECB8D9
ASPEAAILLQILADRIGEPGAHQIEERVRLKQVKIDARRRLIEHRMRGFPAWIHCLCHRLSLHESAQY